MKPASALLAAAASALVAVGLALPTGAATASPSPTPSSSGASSSPSSGASSSPSSEAGSGAARSAASPAADGTASITLAPGGAGTLEPGDDLDVRLRVSNGTEDDLDAGTLRLFLDRPAFESADDVDAWLHPQDPSGSDYLGSLVASVEVPEVAAGETVELDTVTVPESRLALAGRAWGARALGARWLVDGSEQAQARSSVTWFPSQDFTPTRVAVAVPITTPESATGVLDADALAAYTSAGGTLTRQLAPLLGRPVAIAVDPMILASIRLLGADAPASAVAWLDDLTSAQNEVFALSYADSDLAGLHQAGAEGVLGPTSFDQFVDPARFDATATAAPTAQPDTEPSSTDPGGADEPGTAPTTAPPGSAPPLPTLESLTALDSSLPRLAWPVDDTVVADDLAAFTDSGYEGTILSGSNVAETEGTTENAHSTVGGSTALVADDSLSDLLDEAAGARDDVAFDSASARLSATLATVTHERPSDSRTLLLTLDRDWQSSGGRLVPTLESLAAQPWSAEASLADALAAAPAETTVVDRPEDDARLDALRRLVDADRSVVDFSTVLEQPAVVTGPLRLRTLALAAPAWRSNTDGFASEVTAQEARAAQITASVSVVEGSDVAILGDRSSLPVYVQNDTDSPATVHLTVVPSNSFLSVEESSLPVTVQARSQGRVMVPVTSIANGPVVVTMTLASQTGTPVGVPATVAITVQAGWETAITGTLGAIVVLLFGGGILRSVRKRRKARAAA